MSDDLRIGICGAGTFGSTRARALASQPGVRLVAGWSRRAATRARFTGTFGAPCVDTWEELCCHDGVDAVLVCTPHVEHVPQARAALTAGKHVLVETPLALRAADAHELARLAETAGVVLHHGAKWRYHPDRQTHIAQQRQVGELLVGLQQVAFDFGAERMWYADASLTGGARSFLPYLMCDWLEAFGEVVDAEGATSRQDDWEAATILLRFAGGGHATIGYALGLAIPEVATRQLLGTRGTITEGEAGAILVQGDTRTPLVRAAVDIVACECGAFVEEVRGVRDHRPALALDVRACELVDEAFGSDPA